MIRGTWVILDADRKLGARVERHRFAGAAHPRRMGTVVIHEGAEAAARIDAEDRAVVGEHREFIAAGTVVRGELQHAVDRKREPFVERIAGRSGEDAAILGEKSLVEGAGGDIDFVEKEGGVDARAVQR